MRLSFPATCLLAAACGGGPGDGFASSMGPQITSASWESAVSSSSSAESNSTAGEPAGSTSSASSTSSANSTSASTGTIYDLGAGSDLGSLQPPGCKDKIDFLFVMQRYGQLPEAQQKLIDAFPTFIDTIQAKFAGFDVHIMVTDSDNEWGLEDCDPVGCIDADGDGCLLKGVNEDTFIPDYPCGVYSELTKDKCYTTMGAGMVFNAGVAAANTPCDVDGGRRYVTDKQSELKKTFSCMARVGHGGGSRIGEPIVAAVGPYLNADGGCNAGFLRPDALLMITTVTSVDDYVSEGTPEQWADAVVEAKNGNQNAVIVLGIGKWGADLDGCQSPLCRFVRRFPFHKFGQISAPDYGEHFAAAVDLVDEACKAFNPPG